MKSLQAHMMAYCGLINIYIPVSEIIHAAEKTICDPLCENPAKVIFLWFAVVYKKIILRMVKNILWKFNLYIFNIDRVRSCQRLKLMVEIKLWCLLSYNLILRL